MFTSVNKQLTGIKKQRRTTLQTCMFMSEIKLSLPVSKLLLFVICVTKMAPFLPSGLSHGFLLLFTCKKHIHKD